MKLLTLALLSILVACNTLPSEGLPVVPGHLVMERMMIPGNFTRADGSTYTVNLDAIIYRPDDAKKHPLVVINHGYDPVNFKSRYVEDFQRQALEFARRGWVAIAFSRRGYGHSGGYFIEGVGACNLHSFVRGGVVPLADMREVLRFMGTQAYVDASNVVAVGHSGGGFAMIALAAKPLPGVRATINFAGAIRPSDSNNLPCFNETLIKAATDFGKTAHIPTLWIYAENDTYSPAALGRQMHKAFVDAGGNAEFITGIWFPNEGHRLFFYPQGIPIWTPYVDAFLEKQGLKQLDGLISTSDIRIVNEHNVTDGF
jgi:dienelactone hydrolase